MSKVVHIHDRERKAAKCLGLSLQDFLRRKAVLLAQVKDYESNRSIIEQMVFENDRLFDIEPI